MIAMNQFLAESDASKLVVGIIVFLVWAIAAIGKGVAKKQQEEKDRQQARSMLGMPPPPPQVPQLAPQVQMRVPQVGQKPPQVQQRIRQPVQQRVHAGAPARKIVRANPRQQLAASSPF